MNTLFSRLRKSVALFSVAALLSTLMVVAPASAAWYTAAVEALDGAHNTEEQLARHMSRQDAAVVLHRALGSPMAATMTMETLPFTDKAEISAYAVNAVLFHTEEGLLQGNPDGTLSPTAGLNRAELVVILDRAGVLGEDMANFTPAQEAEFVGAEWARAAFARAVASGVVQGYPDGTLRPAGPVNAAETFVLAYRAFVAPAEPTDPVDPVDPSEEYDFTSPLQGDAGTITAVKRTAGTVDEVQEGANDVVVLGFEVEAKDSDVRLQNVRLELRNLLQVPTQSVLGSTRLERYATEVSVWQGDREVGRVNASDFTRTRQSDTTDLYSRSVPLSNAVVRQDDKITFFVAISGQSNIDSADFDARWNVEVANVRYEDATGVVTTESYTTTSQTTGPLVTNVGDLANVNVRFEDSLASGQAELRFSRAGDNPDSQAIEVNRTASTRGVTTLELTMRTQAEAILLEDLPVSVVVTDPGGGVTLNQASTVVERLSLFNGSTLLRAVDVPTSGGLINSVVFDDLNLTLAGNSSTTLRVEADFRRQAPSGAPAYDPGTTVATSVTVASVVAENAAGDRLNSPSNLRGSANGEEHSLFVDGISVALVSTPAPTKSTPGEDSPDEGEFNIVFDVTAFGDDVYLDPAVVRDFFAISGAALNDEDESLAATLTSSAKIVSSEYEVVEGTTERFTLTVSIIPEVDTDAGFREVSLIAVPFNIGTPAGTAATYTSNLDAFRTGSINLVFRD